jgi:hypothetical protein
LCLFDVVPACLNAFAERTDLTFVRGYQRYVTSYVCAQVGVEIYTDCARLFTHWSLHVGRHIDLRAIAYRLNEFMAVYRDGWSLKALGGYFDQDICVPTTITPSGQIVHNWRLVSGNWAAMVLTEQQVRVHTAHGNHAQIVYAARDALAAYGVYIQMHVRFAAKPNALVSARQYWQQLHVSRWQCTCQNRDDAE